MCLAGFVPGNDTFYFSLGPITALTYAVFDREIHVFLGVTI